jgi:hypothetical protein
MPISFVVAEHRGILTILQYKGCTSPFARHEAMARDRKCRIKEPKLHMLGLSFEARQLPNYFGLRNRLGLGWMVSNCAPTTTTMAPKTKPTKIENILFSWLSG